MSDERDQREIMRASLAPMTRRRAVIGGAAALAGGAAFLRGIGEGRARDVPPTSDEPYRPRAKSADAQGRLYSEEHWDRPGEPGRDYTPVVTPNGWTLPFKVADGVKVFHLVAEEVQHEFAPGLAATCWGFNGGVHGPTIEAVEGDRIRIYVTNRLRAPHSVHWHGLLLPNGMDGVGGLTQPVIRPGETFKYEFTLRQHGTHMYHSHHDEMTQMALGQIGLIVIHPRFPKVRPDRDFALLISEWQIRVGTSRPNPNEMTDFNIFTFNAKVFPSTAPMVAKLGDRVRMRFVNLGAMDHHPIHLHGYQFPVIETDGGQIPESAWQMETSVLTAVGQSRAIEFVADEPGDWAMHCHMTHHVMTQMGDQFPNMIGVKPGDFDAKARKLLPGYMTMGQDGMGDMAEHIESGHMPVPRNSTPMVGGPGPFDYITMGGLFTILKVHPDLQSYDDPGWYKHPPGTVADRAAAQELERDGIAGDASSAPRAPRVALAAHRQAPPPKGQYRGTLPSPRGSGGGGGHGGHR
jgi:FtsP/CotA-like multicopper oxidase with cupredoxin domain